MEQVTATYPNWRRMRPAIPSEPVIFTSVASLPVRQYEAALLMDLPWPSATTPREKATCVRVMATQLLPLLQEYTQLRDHVQGYLGQMHTWHTEVLMPHLKNMETEMHRLKLHAFVRGQTGIPSHAPPSAAPSLISAPSSLAESIAEAQAVAASLRSQGPAMVFSSRPNDPTVLNPNQGWAGPNQGQAEPNQGQADPNQGQAHPHQGQMWLQVYPAHPIQSQIGTDQGQGGTGHQNDQANPNQEQGIPEQSQTGQHIYQ